MPKKNTQRTNTKTYSIIAGIFTLILFTLLAISSIILQKQLRKSQDLRQEAWSSDQGAVYINTYPEPGSVFNVNEPITLQLLMNTTTASIDGIQLLSSLNGKEAIVNNEFTVTANTDLNNTNLNINNFEHTTLVNDEYSHTVQLLAITDNPDLNYTSNNTEQVLYTYNFTPTTTGRFTISFSDESFAINSINHSQDELRTTAAGNPPVFTFYVIDPSADCYETDDGRDYDNYGETTGTLSDNVPPEYSLDYCDENGTCVDYCVSNEPDVDLNEWFCYTDDNNQTTVSFERRICDNGCANGACITDSNPSPTPTIDPSITPTVTPSVGNACPAPNNLSVERDSITCIDEDSLSLTVNWDAVSGATQYGFFAYNLLDPGQTTIIEILNANQTSYTINNQAEGPWYFSVVVYDSDEAICSVDLSNYADLYTSYYCENEEPISCEYTNCEYGSCNNGYRSVTCYLAEGSDNSCAASITNNEVCMSQCNYSCGNWSACGEDQIQTRTCTATNTPCWDYSGNNRGDSYTESRYCEVPDVTDILFASYELCWYGESDGISTYIAWDVDSYPQVEWVDVSPYADFSRFAHKNVANADLSNGYGVTNGQNFFWHDNGDRFYFSPETTYYARLYYYDGQGHRHSRTVSFRMARCAGAGGASYRQCNDSCSSNSQCASGLACHEGRCRLPSNLDSEICLDPQATKGCAQWCADNRECQEGLTCWYNYCRNPKNIDVRITDEYSIALELERARQTNCADWHPDPEDYYYIYYSPASQQSTKGASEETKGGSLIKGCDEYCSSNAQCEMNMRCYQNHCRLAINPESDICDPDDQSGTKGGSQGQTSDSSQSNPEASPTPEKFYLDNDILEEDESAEMEADEVKEEEIASQTALDVLKEYLAQKGVSLKSLAILAGVLLLILIILIILAAKDQSNSQYKAKTISKAHNLTPPPSAMRKPQQTTNIPPAPKPSVNNTGKTAPPPSMINRLQDKGVKPPTRESRRSK